MSERDEQEPDEPAPRLVLVQTRYGWRQVPEDTATHWSELVWHDRPPL